MAKLFFLSLDVMCQFVSKVPVYQVLWYIYGEFCIKIIRLMVGQSFNTVLMVNIQYSTQITQFDIIHECTHLDIIPRESQRIIAVVNDIIYNSYKHIWTIYRCLVDKPDSMVVVHNYKSCKQQDSI